MASPVVPKVFIETVAAEMVSGIDAAVEGWMMQIEAVLDDPRLTTLGRLYAVQEIVASYRAMAGATLPHCSEA
jgi:hypothetical protein